jgi:hypothetical protein
MAGHRSAKRGTAAAGTGLPLLPLLLGVLVIGLTLGLGGRTGPDPTAGSIPATSIEPLYLGRGVGIVATYPTFGRGCPRLYSTTDFTHWHNISPPQPPSSVGPCAYVWSSASFISSEEGWVLGRNGGATDTVLYRTVNGGRSWQEQPGSATGSNGGEQVIGFTSPTDGWRQQFTTGSNAPYLLETTADGGETWTEVPQESGNGGCMFALDAFANPADGYAAPRLAEGFGAPPPQPFIWRTVDGGRSWFRLALPRPAEVAGVAAYDSPPSFVTATVGILPVSYRVATGASTLAFYVTSDAGRSWILASTMRSRSGDEPVWPAEPLPGDRQFDVWYLGRATPTGPVQCGRGLRVAVVGHGGGRWRRRGDGRPRDNLDACADDRPACRRYGALLLQCGQRPGGLGHHLKPVGRPALVRDPRRGTYVVAVTPPDRHVTRLPSGQRAKRCQPNHMKPRTRTTRSTGVAASFPTTAEG